MKKKVLILSNFDGRNDAKFKKYARPDQEVQVYHMRSFYVAWDGRTMHIQRPDGTSLAAFDSVYLAGWRTDTQLGLTIAHWLKNHNIPFIGQTSLDVYPTSKLGEMAHLTAAGIPYPKTFYTSYLEQLTDLFDWAHNNFGLQFPVIVKVIDGMSGNHNYKVNSKQELADLDLRPDRHYMMQEFIPNSFDYRVGIIGGKICFVMKRTRTSQDTHLNNTSKGATVDFVDVTDFPKKYADIALKAARTLNRWDISGVDLMLNTDTNKPYVLEVNRTPAIAMGVSETVDIAQKLKALYAYLDEIAK